MKKRFFHLSIAVFIIIVLTFIGVKAVRKVVSVNETNNAIMWESHYLFSTLSRDFECTEPLTVVCLGNSITKHPYLPDVEWYGDWGMAASSPEKDYCHVLQKKLKEYNPESKVIPCTIVPFEKNPYCDLDSLMNACRGGDTRIKLI